MHHKHRLGSKSRDKSCVTGCGAPREPTGPAVPCGRRQLRIVARAIAVLVALLLAAAIAAIGGWAYRLHNTETPVIDRLQELNASFGRSAAGPEWLTGWLMRHNLPVIKRLAGIDSVGPAFCDKDLKLLRRSTRIGYLDLDRTRVTDAGMVYLEAFGKLHILELDSTQVTDVGLTSLKEMTQLRVLTLRDTAITNAGLTHLRNLKGLVHLDLGNTHVTDEGLSSLVGLAALERLDLDGTDVTKDGVDRLRRALPNAEVNGP